LSYFSLKCVWIIQLILLEPHYGACFYIIKYEWVDKNYEQKSDPNIKECRTTRTKTHLDNWVNGKSDNIKNKLGQHEI
jgi:hypothetical protein